MLRKNVNRNHLSFSKTHKLNFFSFFILTLMFVCIRQKKYSRGTHPVCRVCDRDLLSCQASSSCLCYRNQCREGMRNVSFFQGKSSAIFLFSMALLNLTHCQRLCWYFWERFRFRRQICEICGRSLIKHDV